MIKFLMIAVVLLFIATRLGSRHRCSRPGAIAPAAFPAYYPAPRPDQAQRLAAAADAYRAYRDSQAFAILSHPDTDWAGIAAAACQHPSWPAQQLAATLAQPGGHTVVIDELQHASPQRRAWILATLQACLTAYPIAA